MKLVNQSKGMGWESMPLDLNRLSVLSLLVCSQSTLFLKPGRFGLRGHAPIVLKPGVSLLGNKNEPTIFTTLTDPLSNEPATIQGK
jgi:hypothetical protein